MVISGSFGGVVGGAAAGQGWASWAGLLIGQLALADEIVVRGGGGSIDRSKDHPPLPGVSADYRVRPTD